MEMSGHALHQYRIRKRQVLPLIRLERSCGVPIYQQIVNCISDGVRRGDLKRGDLMPSIIDLSERLSVSKHTAEKVYKKLKQAGLLKAVRGKTYYIDDVRFMKKRVVMLFDELNNGNSLLFNTVVGQVRDATFELQIYNGDLDVLDRLIDETSFRDACVVIITPADGWCGKPLSQKLKNGNKGQVRMMQKSWPGYTGMIRYTHLNDQPDLLDGLRRLKHKLDRYQTLKLICLGRQDPNRITTRFKDACDQLGYQSRIIRRATQLTAEKGVVFITMSEGDLESVITKLSPDNYKLGRDIGVISLCENPFMSFIAGGITTISTDFTRLAGNVIKFIEGDLADTPECPVAVTIRSSL